MKTLLALVLCASSLSIFASELPKDTVDKYVIDNVAIDKFDGKQLTGKSISQYTITCKNVGKVVERRHIITTNVGNAALKAKVLRAHAATKNKNRIGNKYMQALSVFIAENGDRADSILRNGQFQYTNGKIVEVNTDSLTRARMEEHPYVAKSPCLTIVDGKEMPMGYRISRSKVARVIYHKPGSTVAKSYGKKGQNGVQVITTWEGKKKGNEVEMTVEESVLTTDYKGLVIVDGKEAKTSDLNQLNKNDVTAAYVLEPGSKAAKSYGEKGKNGVTIIHTIKSTAGKAIKTVYIDGQKVDESEMNKLSPNNIAAMSVAKNKDGEAVVIYVETKQNKKQK